MLRKGLAVKHRDKDAQELNERLFIGAVGVNCLQYTKRCIASVQTTCKDVRFLYIDNGSDPKNCEQIKGWRNTNTDIDTFNVAFNGYNAGVSVAWNQLIRTAISWGATKILICNNDIAFGPKTIDALVYAFNKLRQEDDRTVMVTATNHTKNPAELPKIKQQWVNHEHPDFSCFMITPECIDRVGWFDKDYMPAFLEDNDYHWRILLSGYKAWGTDWAPYSHIASRTREENPNIVTHIMFRKCKVHFWRKFMTRTVQQEIADQRYEAYYKATGEKHPKWQSVNAYAHEHGLISNDLIKWLENVGWEDHNFPHFDQD